MFSSFISEQNIKNLNNMAKQKVILISGNLKSGKSTVSRLLKNRFEIFYPKKKFKIYSFASKIKKIAKESFGWDGEKDKKGRTLLQRLGTEVGRAYNEDIWVNYFSEELKNNTDTIYFVDDWRYPNEKDKIDFDGDVYTVRVNRKRVNNGWFKKLRVCFQKKHTSENSLPNTLNSYDFWLYNNYNTVDDLEEAFKFQELYKEIKNFLK